MTVLGIHHGGTFSHSPSIQVEMGPKARNLQQFSWFWSQSKLGPLPKGDASHWGSIEVISCCDPRGAPMFSSEVMPYPAHFRGRGGWGRCSLHVGVTKYWHFFELGNG